MPSPLTLITSLQRRHYISEFAKPGQSEGIVNKMNFLAAYRSNVVRFHSFLRLEEPIPRMNLSSLLVIKIQGPRTPHHCRRPKAWKEKRSSWSSGNLTLEGLQLKVLKNRNDKQQRQHSIRQQQQDEPPCCLKNKSKRSWSESFTETYERTLCTTVEMT